MATSRISTAKSGVAQLATTVGSYLAGTQPTQSSLNATAGAMSGSPAIADQDRAIPTFFIVHYGANKRLVLNVNCRCDMLEQTIRQKCTIPQATEFELLDPDGLVVNFGGGPQHADFLRSRCLYVIVQRLPNRSYVPLLENFEKLHPVLAARLKDLNDKMQEVPRAAPPTKSRTSTSSVSSSTRDSRY